MIVVDASVLTDALTDDGPVGDAARRELARDDHWVAPEHLLVEAFSAVRGRHLGGKITHRRAGDAISALQAAALDTLATAPLLRRMWELRDNLSGYDAAYVAAAEACDCALVTADTRLANANGPRCEFRVATPE